MPSKFIPYGISPKGRRCRDCGNWTNQPINERCWDCHKRDKKRRRQVSSRKRTSVFNRDGGVCIYCGIGLLRRPHPLQHLCEIAESAAEWEIDHITSVDDGGTSDLDNLHLTCVGCNKRKGTLSDSEYRKILRVSDLPRRNTQGKLF